MVVSQNPRLINGLGLAGMATIQPAVKGLLIELAKRLFWLRQFWIGMI